MPTRKLLVEIGTEELPPKSLATLGTAFARGVADGLAAAGIPAGRALPYFSPRRLAVLIDAVGEMMPESSERRLGPAVKAAFDADGRPTRAAQGFAASCGIAVEALETVTENGSERVAGTLVNPGRPTPELLPGIIETALAALPIARRMRWGDGDTEFVRPVHWVLLLFGDEIVAAEVLGIRAGGETRGHRFHSPAPVRVPSPDAYVATLAAHKVRVNDADGSLAAAVRAAAAEAAEGVDGRPVGLESGLADEVAALNEWPVPVVGGFDRKYLALPPEVLVTTLEHHQRYFPIVRAKSDIRGAVAPLPQARTDVGDNPQLMPFFIAFANIESADPDVIRRGNERVVTPRLEDAMFFWNQDRVMPLESRRAALSGVAWQKRLGSLGDKAARIAALAAALAPRVGGDADTARRAGELAKCDLLTAMVGEFPELQGTIGRHYALHDGEPAAVAQAIEEHYLPRFAGDRLPETPAGRALALADRIDTLAGVFAAGQRPTGDKDPFGLRRAASGVLRILIDCGLDLDLHELFTDAAAALPADLRDDTLADELFEFALDRLRAILIDAGTTVHVFEAVAAVRPTRPLDFVARVRAVEAFAALPEAAALAAANKRIANILRQAGDAAGRLDPGALTEPAERSLAAALDEHQRRLGPLLDAGEYAEALRGLAALRAPVDAFFEDVMVMADDASVRANRIALLGAVAGLFGRVADIGRLQDQ